MLCLRSCAALLVEREVCACAAFAEQWQDTICKTGETRSFYNNFFQVFGGKRRTVAR